MKKITLLLVMLFVCFLGNAQTSLTAGDIAFMGGNSDGITNADDNFAFVLLKDIDAATTITFTDQGWNDATGFFSDPGDGSFTWTSGVVRTAGDIITLTFSTLSPGSATFSFFGDQLFAIQGTLGAPIFIAGLTFNTISGANDANWDGAATNNSSSARPNALTGNTAIRIIDGAGNEWDNFQFSCTTAGGSPITGTPDAIRTILHDRSNWNGTNAAPIFNPVVQAGCTTSIMLAADNTPPVITCALTPGSITAGINGMAAIPDLVTGSSATDDVSSPANIIITQSPTAGTMQSVGVHAVTVTATDEAGNMASCMINVTIVEPPSTVLSAGDIAFVGFNLDGTDGFAFILLRDIIVGTNIKFTDCGVSNPNTITCVAGDGTNTWYAPAAMSAGDIVSLDGTFFTDPLASQGDQLFAYQGTEASPVFLTGIHSNIESGVTNDTDWDGGNTNNDESALPDQLINGVNAIRLHSSETEIDNWQFDCSTLGTISGTPSQVAAIINTLANWDNDNDTEYVPAAETAGCTYTVTISSDVTPPVISDCGPTPPDILADVLGNATLPDLTGAVVATDETTAVGDLVITQSPSAGTTITSGVTVVTLFVTDEGGNTATCTINVTVVNIVATTLAAGDIAFVGINQDGADEVAFILLKGILAGTMITFTDCGVNNPNTIDCIGVNDSTNIWFSPTDMPAGSIVTLDNTFLTSLSNLGEQIFAYQGDAGSPTFIAGIHTSVVAGTNDTDWDGANTDGFTSALPDQLTNGVNAIRLHNTGTEVDNWQFDCTLVPGGLPVTGTAAQVAAIINDIQYWIFNDITPFNPASKAGCTYNLDAIPPTAVCMDITVQLNGAGSVTIVAFDVDGGSTDNVGIVSYSVDFDTFDCTDIGTPVTVTLTVADAAGNSATCTSTVTVEDNVAPTAICQDITVQLDATGNASITGADVDGGSTDNCGIASLSVSPSTFNCVQEGATIPVTLTVTDVNGNSSSCVANVTVDDSIAPMAVCQDITVQLDASGNASISPADVEGGSSDNCGFTNPLSVTPNTFTCANVGENIVTLTVGDGNGNQTTCTATVTVEDTTPPTISCPADITVGNDPGLCSASVILPLPNVVENCGVVEVSLSLNGSTIFDYVFVPQASGLEQPRQVIFGPDGHLYVSDLVFGDTGTEGKIVKYDGTTGAFIMEIGGPSGSTSLAYPRGMDFGPDGNLYVSSSNSLEVLRFNPNTGALIDAFVPEGSGGFLWPTGLVFGPDGHLYVSNRGTDTVLKYDGTSGAFISEFVSPGDGGLSFPIGLDFGPDGNLYVTSFATNSVIQYDGASGAFMNAFVTSGSGGLSGPEDLEFGPDGNLYVTSFFNGQVLSYDGTTGAFISDISATGVTLGAVDGLTFGPDGHLYVANTGLAQIVRYPLGALDIPVGVNEITTTVTDGSGLMDSCFFNVTVNDIEAPSVICKDVTVALDAGGNASITPADVDGGANDACGIASLSVAPNTFDCTDVGSNIVTLTVTDVNGKTSTCTSNVTVEDNVPPVGLCQDITIQLDAGGNASITPADVDGGSNDACGIASLSVAPNTFDCTDVGSNIVTLTVTDVNGNTSTCTSNVTVEDNVPPVALCQDITIQLDAGGNASITPADVDGGSNDSCGIASLSVAPNTFDCTDVGSNIVTLTVTDVNGKTSTCTSNVTVEDNVPPVALCQDITIQLDAGGNASITPADVDGGSNDSCGIASLSVAPNTFDCTDVGSNIVTLTVTDVNGNTSTCTSNVTVEDNVPPVALCQDITIQLDAGGNASITPADVDGGSNDACGIASMNVSPSSFDCSNVGSNQVTLTVTDVNGNVSSCTSFVTVEDNIDPVVLVNDITIELDANGEASISPVDLTTFSNLTSNNTWLGFIGIFVNNSYQNGSVVAIQDITSYIDIPSDAITLHPNFDPTYPNNYGSPILQGSTYIEEDIVLSESSINFSGSVTNNSLDPNYEAFAFIRVFDSGYNLVEEIDDVLIDGNNFSVEYNNSQPDAYRIQYGFTVMGPSGSGSSQAALGNAVVQGMTLRVIPSDACGIASEVLSETDFDCANLGTNQVTLTVTDNNNNVTIAFATVTVEDNIVPTISCPGTITRSTDEGSCTATVDYVVDFDDNCSGAILTQTGGLASGSAFPFGTTTNTFLVADSSGNSVSCSFDVVVNEITTITSLTVSPNPQQYSDLVDFEATIDPGDCPGAGLAVTKVEFYVGTQLMGTANMISDGENLVGNLTAALLEIPNDPFDGSHEVGPGDHTVTAVFLDVNANYNVANATTNLTIDPEDAIAEYTGLMVQATSGNDNEAEVLLSFNIQDISCTDLSDPDAGDIRNATVQIVLLDGGITPIGPLFTNTDGDPSTDIVLVNPGDTKTGTVSFPYTFGLGGGQSTSASYAVGVFVNGYYIGSDETVINIYKPTGDFITGGGYIIPDNSAGVYASTDGLKTNFGFNVKYTKKGNKVKGHMNIIFRRLESDGVVHKYQIKGNAMQSLGIIISEDGDPQEDFAQFITKANLKDITDPDNPISLGGNLILKVDMTDRGEPGDEDSIAINLTDGGVLLYSSDWTGILTEEMTLSAGNLIVHSGGVGPETDIYVDTSIIDAEGMFDVMMDKNPFVTTATLTLKTDDDTKLVQYAVYDINNKLVLYQELVPSEQFTFGKELGSGMYIVRVTQGSNIKIKRLIKK